MRVCRGSLCAWIRGKSRHIKPNSWLELNVLNATSIFRTNLIKIIIKRWTVHEEHNKSNSINTVISHLAVFIKMSLMQQEPHSRTANNRRCVNCAYIIRCDATINIYYSMNLSVTADVIFHSKSNMMAKCTRFRCNRIVYVLIKWLHFIN